MKPNIIQIVAITKELIAINTILNTPSVTEYEGEKVFLIELYMIQQKALDHRQALLETLAILKAIGRRQHAIQKLLKRPHLTDEQVQEQIEIILEQDYNTLEPEPHETIK